jgi:two-component system, cell cycle sensor histidine kinase and response regulator CckA
MLTPGSLAIAPPKLDEGARSGVGSTILLVDDEAGIRTLAGAVLRDHGYQVLEAEDGLAALEIAARHHGRVHLLLTDWHMPRLDGAGLIRSFAAGNPDAAILIVSGSRDSELPPEAAILPKPFTVENLVRKVWDLLEFSQ